LEDSKMDGSAIGAVADHDKLGRFTTGNTEYRAKQKRLAERLAQLNADYDATPSQQQLLAIAARHLDDAERARSALARTRASNAARRLLADIPRRPEKPLPATLEEYLADE
jgi:hypothetical protein